MWLLNSLEERDRTHFGVSSSVATYQGTLLLWNKSGYLVVRNVSIRFATRALCSTSFSHSSPAKPSLCLSPTALSKERLEHILSDKELPYYVHQVAA
jgi:hypothetical protein